MCVFLSAFGEKTQRESDVEFQSLIVLEAKCVLSKKMLLFFFSFEAGGRYGVFFCFTSFQI